MRTVFGIDVSKASSEVAILVNGERVHGYTMPNDIIGFSHLLKDLKTVSNPEIIFEATGVYSRRLQAFLEENSYDYTRLNPLEAKKQLDGLRVRKTDKIDAEKLASSQFVLNRMPTYVQEKVYQNLHDLSRFYQNLTEDIVRTKNRLHLNKLLNLHSLMTCKMVPSPWMKMLLLLSIAITKMSKTSLICITYFQTKDVLMPSTRF